MKREFLQNLKIGDQALTKEIIDAIMAENGKDVEVAKKPFADYDAVKQQLTDANKAIEGFKAMDVDGIKNAADEWKQKFEQSEAEHAQKLADMEFDGLLSSAITAAKGKNVNAILGTLAKQMDTLKASKNQSEDIKAALSALKESDDYLFEDAKTPPPYAPGTGRAKIGELNKESFAKMGYRERLELKRTSPETYESMKE